MRHDKFGLHVQCVRTFLYFNPPVGSTTATALLKVVHVQELATNHLWQKPPISRSRNLSKQFTWWEEGYHPRCSLMYGGPLNIVYTYLNRVRSKALIYRRVPPSFGGEEFLRSFTLSLGTMLPMSFSRSALLMTTSFALGRLGKWVK